jgi:hypothetical protein
MVSLALAWLLNSAVEDRNAPIDWSQIFGYEFRAEEYAQTLSRAALAVDRSKIPALKPNAWKLSVLVVVPERMATPDGTYNSLERIDKQRTLLALASLPGYASLRSNGTVDLKVIPKFIPEPILSRSELEDVVKYEFNRARFDADDSIDRGPIDAYAVLETVPQSDSGRKPGFLSMPSGVADSNFLLEQRIFDSILDSLIDLNPPAEPDQTGTIEAKYLNLEPSPTLGEIFMTKPEDTSVETLDFSILSSGKVLALSEVSIIRTKQFPLPKLPGSAKSIEFKLKSNSLLKLNLVGETKGKVIEWDLTKVGATLDGTWKIVKLKLPPDGVARLRFQAPLSEFGRNRLFATAGTFEFSDFQISNDATGLEATQAEQVTEKSLSDSNERSLRRTLFQAVPSDSLVKANIAELPKQFSSLDPVIAQRSVYLWGMNAPIEEALPLIQKLISTPPNEFAREGALLTVADRPELGTFETVAQNLVRKSSRVRLACVKALAALNRTELKAKPAARQLLMIASQQDLAVIRSAALRALDPKVEEERKRIEYALVNDPSEAIRSECLKHLSQEPTVQNETLLGALADESPFVRMRAAEMVSSRSEVQREMLQRMVVDTDSRVKVAALQGFATVTNPRIEEFQNLLGDKNERVQLALLAGHLANKWVLPSSTLENFKNSAFASVRRALGGKE